ncbi:hypothetical protein P9112_013774 [Eukaryota sp. TZLM1-RC]
MIITVVEVVLLSSLAFIAFPIIDLKSSDSVVESLGLTLPLIPVVFVFVLIVRMWKARIKDHSEHRVEHRIPVPTKTIVIASVTMVGLFFELGYCSLKINSNSQSSPRNSFIIYTIQIVIMFSLSLLIYLGLPATDRTLVLPVVGLLLVSLTVEGFNNVTQSYHLRIDVAERRMDTKIDVLEKKVDEKFDSLEKIEVLEKNMDEKIEVLEKNMDEKIEVLEKNMDEKIEVLEKNMDEKIEVLEKRMDEKIEVLEKRMDEKIEVLEKRMDEKIEVLEKRMDEKIEVLEKRMDEKIEVLEKRMDQRFDALEKAIYSLKENNRPPVKPIFEEEMEKYLRPIFKLLEKHNKSVLEFLEVVNRKYGDYSEANMK